MYSSREPGNYLAEYALRYNTVEVDQWFWSLGKSGAALPRPDTVADYDLSTPPGFCFTVKCPNALTLTHYHGRKGEAFRPNERFLDQDFFMRFLESLAALVPKIGLFIFQFEYLNKEKMPSRNQFMDRLGVFLAGLPGDMPYAVEIRNPRWMDSTWFKLLQGQEVAPVLLQGYWMDDIAATMDRCEAMPGDTVCIRLHGEDREGMEERTGSDWSQIIRPKDDELLRISGAVTKLLGAGKKAFINVNNHYEGSAPLTIQKIRRFLDEL
ncbi:MAG: DUF72 domain-containing protein [Spirochaetota bacterium]